MRNTLRVSILFTLFLNFSAKSFASSKASCLTSSVSFFKRVQTNLTQIKEERRTLQYMPGEKEYLLAELEELRIKGLEDYEEAINSAKGSKKDSIKRDYITQIEIKLISAQLDYHLTIDNFEVFRNFIPYLNSLKKSERRMAYKSFIEVANQTPYSPFIKKFFKLRKHILAKNEKTIQKRMKKLLKKEGDLLSSEQARRVVTKESAQHLKNYEKVAYGCFANKWTKERKAAFKSFKKFTIGIGLTTSIGAYTYANWNRDTPWQRKYGQLGYELTMNVVKGWISSKILANPSENIWTKSAQKYFVSRIAGLADMAGFSLLFSVSDAEKEKELERILKSPEKIKEVKELIALLENERMWPRFKKLILENYRSLKGSVGLELPKELRVGDIDWDNLKDEDYEREEIQQILLMATATKLYEDKSSELKTGDVGVDRWSFHSLYGLAMLPKGMFVSYQLIYKTLCLGSLNPSSAAMTALGYYTLDRVIFDRLYYKVRGDVIDQ